MAVSSLPPHCRCSVLPTLAVWTWFSLPESPQGEWFKVRCPYWFTSSNLKRCQMAGRYFPDWEKQKWKRGILERRPRSLVPRGRNQHLVHMHTCVGTRCVVAFHLHTLWSHETPLMWVWHLIRWDHRSSASLDSKRICCCFSRHRVCVALVLWGEAAMRRTSVNRESLSKV